MLTMIMKHGGSTQQHHQQTDPTIPWACWPELDALSLAAAPGGGGDFSAALHRYLPCNGDDDAGELAFSVDAYSCDEFRMYEFKVRRCARGRAHDWTECPFAHPGEKARRRDPRRHHYSGAPCPDFRKSGGGAGGCRRGDSCEFAHGVFEIWLHPARYRTQPCKDGTACRRRICFFAHTPEQFRILPDSYDGSPIRRLSAAISPQSDSSPPMSPMRRAAVNEVVASFRHLQLGKAKSLSPATGWGFASPRAAVGAAARGGSGGLTTVDSGGSRWIHGEMPAKGMMMESGKALREKMMVELLCREYGIDRSESGSPDVGWVSELVM